MRLLSSIFLCGTLLPFLSIQDPAPPTEAPRVDPRADPKADPKYDALLKEIGTCASIANGTRRLEAFDALAKKLGVGPKPVEGSGKWTAKTSVSPIDDSKTVLLSLEADPESTIRLKGGQNAQLVLRCKQGQIDVYTITGARAEKEGTSPQATVTLRFDKEKAFDVKMDQSTDGEALFWPDPRVHVEKMLHAERLIVVYTPAAAAPALMQFDLRGFALVHPDLAGACAESK